MSYFSDIEYKKKTTTEDLWFEQLYFDRWFRGVDGKILDVGCATGNFMALASDRMVGVDIDEDSLKISKNRGFEVYKVDGDKPLVQFESDMFIGIYAKQVIEHLSDPLAFFKEAYRVLKPGGIAVFLTPNCPYMLGREFYDDYTHIRPFTRVSLAMVAYDAGIPKENIKIVEDFRCFPGLGRIMRTLKISPGFIRTAENILRIRGLSLIIEIRKP